MKKIFFLLAFLFSAFVSFSQVIPKPNPTAVGIGYKRLLADSTIFIPTGGATPRLGANNINRRSAIYADTINKKLYVFYPNDSTWKESGTDTTSLSARIDARVKYADTSSMLAPYLRTANSHGVPSGGTSGQLLSKNSDSDYDLVWIDNYADWTSLIKQQYKATESITKGQAVYVSGADGTNALISKASNASEITSSKTIGLLAQTLSTNGKGFVVTEGLLGGLNTATANVGDPVWLGTNGDLIFGYLNKPHAPAHLVYLGVVTRANGSNGEILIKPQNGYELDELHNVSITGTNNNYGLFYDSLSTLWKNKSIASALGYVPANDANIVHISGTETITGAKTFSNTSTFTGTSIFNNQATFNDIAKINAEIKWIKNPAIQTASAGYLTTYATSGFGLSFFDGDSGNESKFIFNNSGMYTYTYPAASGTLALTSDITTGYVPYTGATADVNLGNHNLSTNYNITSKSAVNARTVFINGNDSTEGDLLGFKQYPSTFSGTYKTTAISAVNNNQLIFTFWHDTTLGGFLRYKSVAFKTDSLDISGPGRQYYFPNASGVLALKGDLTTGYVPYSGATQNTDLGNFGIKSSFVQSPYIEASLNGTLSSPLVLKTGTTGYYASGGAISLVSSPTSANTLSVIADVAGVQKRANFNLTSLSAARTYTLPDATGTIALTSDITSALANYVTLTGAQTISGAKTFSSGATFFNNPVANGLNAFYFSSASTTTAQLSIDTVFTQFQSFGSYGYLFKMKDGSNGLAIRNDGSGFQLNLPFSGTSGFFSSTLTSSSSVKGTNFILSGGTGNTGLYYGHTDRVVLANYTAGGIDFETNGGTVNMTLFPNGNLGVGTSLTDDGVNKLQVAGGGKFNGTLTMDGSGGTANPITLIYNTSNNRLLTPLLRLYGSTNIGSNYVELYGTNATSNRTVNFPDASGTVVLGSGTTNYLPKFTSGNAIGNSVLLIDSYLNSVASVFSAANGTQQISGMFTGQGSSSNTGVMYFGAGEPNAVNTNAPNPRSGLKIYQSWNGTYTDTKFDLFTLQGGVGGNTVLTGMPNGTAYFPNNVGIGTSTPSNALVVSKGVSGTNRVQILPTTDYAFFQVDHNAGTTYIGTDNSTGSVFGKGNYSMNIYNSYAGNINFYTNSAYAAQITASTQNFLIGTTTDNGFKLQVAGNVSATGTTQAPNFITASGTAACPYGSYSTFYTVQNYQNAIYLVTLQLNGYTTYSAFAIIVQNDSGLTIVNQTNNNAGIQVSGLNIQGTNGSGITQSMVYKIFKIS